MEELGIEGENTVLSLTTLQSENHSMKSQVLSLEVYDLEENDLVELPTVFSTSTLLIHKSSIPRQSDIDRWPYLSNVKITETDSVGTEGNERKRRSLSIRSKNDMWMDNQWTSWKKWKSQSFHQLYPSRQCVE